MKTFYASGAYGRKADRKDWDDGLDFRARNGQYFSHRDADFLKEVGYTQILFVEGTNPRPLFIVRLDDA